MPQLAPARRPSIGVPTSALDPFSLDFLRDPHPAHEALREAGPVVWLEQYGAYAVARHAEVRQVLNDPALRVVGTQTLPPRSIIRSAKSRLAPHDRDSRRHAPPRCR
jgi:cytochrome P450